MPERNWIAVLVGVWGVLACRAEEAEPGNSAGRSRVDAAGSGVYPNCSSTGRGSVEQVARAELEGSGSKSVVSRVTLALSVAALLERPAFDEGGGLWLALNQNRFGRLTPAQLSASSTAGAPTTPATIITSPNMGYANRMAFFPAAAGLPLYHRFR